MAHRRGYGFAKGGEEGVRSGRGVRGDGGGEEEGREGGEREAGGDEEDLSNISYMSSYTFIYLYIR